jgi:hypothetical protein
LTLPLWQLLLHWQLQQYLLQLLLANRCHHMESQHCSCPREEALQLHLQGEVGLSAWCSFLEAFGLLLLSGKATRAATIKQQQRQQRQHKHQ